ncbi:MAG: hypothetical protein BGO95_07680 [Micrococcales bacterium 73-13]|nr:MAG: hypothetical protein BGO95_07680 [Micrococcales bacterium 73-13]
MVLLTVFVAVSITDTVSLEKFVTYALSPEGEMAISLGKSPTEMSVLTVVAAACAAPAATATDIVTTSTPAAMPSRRRAALPAPRGRVESTASTRVPQSGGGSGSPLG